MEERNNNYCLNDPLHSTSTSHVYSNSKMNGERKFIGGAARARINAVKKRKAIRIIRPDELQKAQEVIPYSLSPYERFFASLLRSTATEFVSSNKNQQKNSENLLWKTICSRLNLPFLQQPLLACYNNFNDHFAFRASLVMEESRQAISDGLYQLKQRQTMIRQTNYNNMNEKQKVNNKKRQRRDDDEDDDNNQDPDQQQNQRNVMVIMNVRLTNIEEKKSGHFIVTFKKEENQNNNFTKDEMLSLRHGTIFACQQQNSSTNMDENIVLATVLPQNRDDMIETKSFSVMIFHKFNSKQQQQQQQQSNDTSIWTLTSITSLLSEQRKYEACIIQIRNKPVSFIYPLLGGKKAQHIRFNDNNDNQIENDTSDNNSSTDGSSSCSDSDDNQSNCSTIDEVDDDDADSSSIEIIEQEDTIPNTTSKSKMLFQLPKLNMMQEKAATTFLRSKQDTITLIQGPPGTGKTTLLVSVIGRYVMETQQLQQSLSSQQSHHNRKRCLMVCAPTNKAITVLCTRFLNSILEENEHFPCNIVLIGDDDKLLDEDDNNDHNNKQSNAPSKLRSIYLYTFIDTIVKDYKYMRNAVLKDKSSKRILTIACRLHNRLKQSITDQKVCELAKTIVKMTTNVSKSSKGMIHAKVIEILDEILIVIESWNRESIWKQILERADVIFCTLASAGTSILKKGVSEVDDLIVDEAAAATEPEMYIPFQYYPRRLLAVGDPMQLPATIISRKAEKLGLSKSLHERLMYDCGHEHIMLDIQYRMKPPLSQFPSMQFYNGKLINAEEVTDSNYSDGCKMMNGAPYAMYQINGIERRSKTGSMENEAEARAVIQIVKNLRDASSSFTGNWCAVNRLRIITFYQAQAALIKKFLQQQKIGKVLVATVDSSQGCEADFVIVSFVRSYSHSQKDSVGFLTDARRLNVSLTRAKFQMICVGNVQRMAAFPDGKADIIRSLAVDALQRKCALSFLENKVLGLSNKNNLDTKSTEQKSTSRDHESSQSGAASCSYKHLRKATIPDSARGVLGRKQMKT